MNVVRLVFVFAVLPLLACRQETAPPSSRPGAETRPSIVVDSKLPADVPGGADKADLTTGARFAWQQFISLNWPADPNRRGQPDAAKPFADAGLPLVWETYRSKVEIYPPGGSAVVKPHGYKKGAPDFGWNDPPMYPYAEPVRPCGGGQRAASWINLDEISQVGFAHMYAGAAPGKTDEERLVRYTAKANETHYTYAAANKYWYASDDYKTATSNFVNAVTTGDFQPGTKYVLFPNGAIEAKAAFRRLTLQERDSGRYHVARVRFYETTAAGDACFQEEDWGLLALHIIQKTPTAPAYTWATFEQADNIRTEDGKPVEDADGKILIPGLPADTPALAYKDGVFDTDPSGPCVSVAGVKTPPCVADPATVPFCKDPKQRLYYAEIAGSSSGTKYDRIPAGGFICVTGRAHPIPDPVIGVNREAHAAIADYEKQRGLRRSPWHYYKLVNVQTFPFDKSTIGNDPVRRATYFTSNILVETDYTLQHHSGGPEPYSGGAPSDLPENFPAQQTPAGQPAATTYQNTYVLNADGSFQARYNMGGCTGCHGEAQVRAGTDYSYIMVQPVATEPETAGTAKETLRGRYVGRLRR